MKIPVAIVEDNNDCFNDNCMDNDTIPDDSSNSEYDVWSIIPNINTIPIDMDVINMQNEHIYSGYKSAIKNKGVHKSNVQLLHL